MKRSILLLLCVFFVFGCGGNKSDKDFEGVKSNHDFMQEGYVYLKKADIPKAIQSFDKAIQQDPTNSHNYLIVGQVYLKLNNYVRASDSFAAAIKVDPTNAIAYYLLGQSQVSRGQIKEAVESLRRSMAIYKAKNDVDNFSKVSVFLKGLLENGREAVDQANK